MLFSIVLVLLTAILVAYELYRIYNARKKGLTKNVTRLITHTIMIVLLSIVLIQIIYLAIKLPKLLEMAR